MKSELVEFMASSSEPFAIMVDKSTKLNTKTVVIVYIQILFEGKSVTTFFIWSKSKGQQLDWTFQPQ